MPPKHIGVRGAADVASARLNLKGVDMTDTLQKNNLTTASTTSTSAHTAAARAAEAAETNRLSLMIALSGVAVAVMALVVIGVMSTSTVLIAAGGLLMVLASFVGIYSGVNIEADRTV